MRFSLIQEGQLSVSGKLTALDMTPFDRLGRKIPTQTNKQSTLVISNFNNVWFEITVV